MVERRARVLVADIENSPSLGWTWQKYDTDILAFEKEFWILCFAYKWLDEEDDAVHVVAQPDFKKAYKADPTDDYHVMAKMHALLDAADIVIGHNFRSFDARKINARFIANGFLPPSPFKIVDTYLIFKKHFALLSNKLGDVGEFLGLGAKAENHGLSTWLKAMQGDKGAWETLTTYCARDVELTSDVYLKVRPWADGLPSVALINGALDNCPKCGSDNLTKQGFKFNRTGVNQQYRCRDCGGWSSSRLSEKSPKAALVN